MENLDEILSSAKKLIDNCKQLEVELNEMKSGKDFLINEYKTNKHYFRLEPGRVTIEDVIKTAFEFGWSSHKNFEYRNGKVID